MCPLHRFCCGLVSAANVGYIKFSSLEQHQLQSDHSFDFDKCILLRSVAAVGHVVCAGFQWSNNDDQYCSNADKNNWPYYPYHLRSPQCTVFLNTVGSKMCEHCAKLCTFARRAMKRKHELTPVSRAKRARVSSTTRLDYLTPRSKRKRSFFTSQIFCWWKTYFN